MGLKGKKNRHRTVDMNASPIPHDLSPELYAKAGHQAAEEQSAKRKASKPTRRHGQKSRVPGGVLLPL
jgi:hypothetical protein